MYVYLYTAMVRGDATYLKFLDDVLKQNKTKPDTSVIWIHNNIFQVPEYLSYVTRSLEDEERRLRLYLGSSSREQLIKTVETNLIGNHVEALLEKGILIVVLHICRSGTDRIWKY